MMPCRIGFHASLRDFDHARVATGIARGSAAPRAASGASGVPRLISSTPTRGAGMAGWSAGGDHAAPSGRTAGGASAVRSRRRSHWRPPAASTSAPSPLTPPGGCAARHQLDLDLRQALERRQAERAERAGARHAGDDLGRGAGRLTERVEQPAFDLLAHQPGIDDPPASTAATSRSTCDPLVGADARFGEQADVDPNADAQAIPMLLPRAAAVPSAARRRRGQRARQPRLAAEQADAKGERLDARAPAPVRR